MFHHPARRAAPRGVPPARALRTLYQLAYISSGAAVGVAALCAEERRRRTALVQRIADNTRRLRQSPRHVHNAAAAYGEELQEWNLHEDVGVWPEGSVVRTAGGDWKGRAGGEATAAAAPPRGPELPSVVEKGYDQVAGKGGRRVRRRVGARRLSGEERGLSDGSAGNEDSRMNARSGPGDVTRSSWDSGSQQFRRDSAAMQPRKAGNSSQLAHNWSPKPQPTFVTLEHVSGTRSPTLARNVEHDVGLFLEAEPWTRRGLMQERRIADHLFTKALECGALAEIRSVFLWKLAHDLVSEQNLRQLGHACLHLGAENDKNDVLDLYVELFGTTAFENAPPRMQLRLGLEVVTVMMLWGLGRPTRELVNISLSRSLEKSTSNEIHEALEHCTSELLLQGRITDAADLIVSTIKRGHQSALPLADKIFEAASAEGSLTAASDILQWKYNRFERHAESISQYEWFIKECGGQKEFAMLKGILASLERHQWFDWLVPRLSGQARLVLATACTAQPNFPRNIFRRLYGQTPPELADTIAEHHDVLRLQELWAATRDVTAVRTAFEEAQNVCALPQPTDQASGRLIVTMIEVLLSANQPDQAIHLLLKYHPSQMERTHVICLTAVAFAKKKAWKRVDEVLLLLGDTNRSITDTTAVQQLHHVVHLFSRQHAAAQTWAFTTGLIDRCGFVPTNSTTESLLQNFVSNGSYEYISRWLDYIEHLGVDFKIDGKIAAKLVQRLYLRHRPPHIIIMSFCRNLIRRAPWLDESALAGVIRESIAFDMRSASGKNRALIKSLGEQNLAKLQQASKGSVLAPDYNKSGISTRTVPDQSDGYVFDGLSRSDDIAPGIGLLLPVEECDGGQTLNHSRRQRRQLEQDMILAFSQTQHKRVLNLFESVLEDCGRPLSPLALEVAIESAFRLHKGNAAKAKELLSSAQKSGMNVSCAMGPMLIHEMYHLDPSDKKKLDRLRGSVIDYYRSNEANGWATRHHIGVTAANLLIDNNRPLYGIDLLNTIYSSEWSSNRPLDIVAMTVYVKGYAAVKSMNGLRWVVQTVLRDDLRIDRSFTDALKKALPYFGGKFIKLESGLGTRASAVERIREWRRQCLERQEVQRSEAKRQGQKLVDCIVQCSKPELDGVRSAGVQTPALEQIS